MSGILHIFPLRPDVYQVNYTRGTMSWVRTCTREELQHFLVTPAALDEAMISTVLRDIGDQHAATVSQVEITENEAMAYGFEPMPSDA